MDRQHDYRTRLQKLFGYCPVCGRCRLFMITCTSGRSKKRERLKPIRQCIAVDFVDEPTGKVIAIC